MSRTKKAAIEQLEKRRLLSLTVSSYNPANPTSVLTNALLASSSGITQSSAATYIGQNGQAGTYTGFNLTSGSVNLSIPAGIVLTSGEASDAAGLPTGSSGTPWGTPGDADLSALIGGTVTNDANSLTLTFTVPTGTNSISFDLIFGSNEDPNGTYSDVFGAFLDGTQISFDNNRPIDVTNSVIAYENDNMGNPSSSISAVGMDVGYDYLTPELATNAPLNTGLTTHTLKLAIADATDDIVDSGVFLAGLTSSGATLSGPTTGAPGTFAVDQTTQTVVNTAGSVSVVVDRDTGSTGATTVDYATSNGTATAGTDYTSTSGTLSFADGVTSQTITIPIDDNAGGAAGSTFGLTLSNATGGANLGTQLTDTVTIQNSQSLVQLASPTYSSSDTAGSVTLTVNRTGNTTTSATVNYATADGTAAAGINYTATTGTLTFAAGVTSQTITVPLTVDAAAAASSNFTVTLSNPGGSGVLGAQTSSTVTETNPNSSVQFDASTYTFANDAGTGLLTVDRTGDLASSATVQYATANGSALAGTDFTATTGTLTFAASQASQTISIPLLENAAAAVTSTFTVDLSSVGGNGVLGTQTTSTITEQNNHSLLQFAASTFSVASTDGTATLTVNRSGNTSAPATVHYATSNGTAHAGTNYTSTTGTLTFNAGDTSATISVPLLTDPAITTASFAVTLSSPSGSGVLGSQSSTQVAIGNTQSQVAFDSSSYASDNTAGSVVLTVDRFGDSAVPATVDWATSDQTASAGVDYTASTGTLTFAAGQTTGTITVPVLPNASGAAASTFVVTISNPGGNATLGTQAASTVTLTNNQSLLLIPHSTYAAASTDTSVSVLVTRNGNIAQPASVGYSTTDGTALAGTDYTATSGTLNFAAGQSSATITIPVVPVSTRTSDTTFTFSLITPGSNTVLGDRTSATVTIAGSTVVPVIPTPPVITINAFADLVSPTSPAATLHVDATDNATNANLIYTWTILSQPAVSLSQRETSASSSAPAPLALFAINGTADAKNTAVTFLAPGTYVLRVTASNGSVSTYSDVTVSTTVKANPTPVNTTTQVAGVQPISDGSTLTGFVVTFNGPLDPTSAAEISGYKIVAATTGNKHPGFFNRLFGTNPGSSTVSSNYKIASAAYDSTTNSVTLTLAKPAYVQNSTWQVQVTGNGKHAVLDANGKAIDGNADGKAGGTFNYHMSMHLSKSITYQTPSGDTVHLSLTGAGKIITLLPTGSKTPTLFLTGTTPTASILTGTLHKSRKGTGVAVVHELNDSSDATIQLGTEFQVDLYGAD